MTDAGPMRLGFAVKVLGDPAVKSNDARKWQSGPHLRVSLQYLDGVLDHLVKHNVPMYRMSSDIAPYVTHPTMPQFHNQITECRAELESFGTRAKALGLRLSFHPSQFILLNAPDAKIVDQSVRELTAQAEILDIMGCGPEAVMVTHVGGTYGDKPAGIKRWANVYHTLGEPVRRRLVLENDDIRYSAADALEVHGLTGVPLVFDHQHHWCLNTDQSPVRGTVEKFLATWPAGVRPKIHYSSPRTEMRELKRRDKVTKKVKTVLVPPIWTGHADYVNPFEFTQFLNETAGLVFDIMVEAKSKDLAVLRLRKDLPRFAPQHAARFGIDPAVVDVDEVDAEDEGGEE